MRGDQVTVWNRTIAKARALEPLGIRAADTPAAAVRGAARVHLVLRDDDVVEEVIAALRPSLDRDTIIVDHTTTQPAPTAARARRLKGEGVHYLHCPVFINPTAARLGQGTILASGPRASFDAVKDDLARMAQRLEYLGERPDLAAVYKLCGNAFVVGVPALIADTFAIAGESQVTPEDALRLFDFFDPMSIIAGRGRNMAAGNFAPNFTLVMARKDVQIMLETAREARLNVLPAVAARMDALIAEGHGEEDLGVLAKEVVRLVGAGATA